MVVVVIYICSLYAMVAAVATARPSHLVSILDPDDVVPTPPGVSAGNHLRIGVHDIGQPVDGYIAPEAGHIESLLAFGAGWDRKAPLLVHCFAGVSRSMAAALILVCQINAGREREAALLLRARAGHAMPNRRMIALADQLMRLDGRLVEAVRAMPPPDLLTIGQLVALPAEL